MAPKRPAPLSDEMLIGTTNNGVPLPVKNTFIDVPSGLTPANMKQASYAKSQLVCTAPAEFSLQPPGFLRQAIVASVVSQQPPVCSPACKFVPVASPVGVRRPSMTTPLATPSPTAYAAPAGWVQAAVAAYGGMGQAPAAQAPPPCFAAAAPLPWGNMAQASFITAVNAPSVPLCYGPTMLPRPQVPTSTVAEDPGEDDEDDDSEGEVPPHLRNPEDAPKPPPGALHPSLGSDEHPSGCKRCCFFPRGRCSNGYNCEFCHYEHEKRKRKNKKKKKKSEASGAVAADAAQNTYAVAEAPTAPTAMHPSLPPHFALYSAGPQTYATQPAVASPQAATAPPPPHHTPHLAQVSAEPMLPPPPMQSPKITRVVQQGGRLPAMLPPPMASPRLPRSLQQGHVTVAQQVSAFSSPIMSSTPLSTSSTFGGSPVPLSITRTSPVSINAGEAGGRSPVPLSTAPLVLSPQPSQSLPHAGMVAMVPAPLSTTPIVNISAGSGPAAALGMSNGCAASPSIYG